MAKLVAGQVPPASAWDHIILLGLTDQGREQGSRAAYLAAHSHMYPSVGLTTMERLTGGKEVETFKQKAICKGMYDAEYALRTPHVMPCCTVTKHHSQ